MKVRASRAFAKTVTISDGTSLVTLFLVGSFLVTTGLDPVVHADLQRRSDRRPIPASRRLAWIAGSSPAMTT
jgi:hypothetical protein